MPKRILITGILFCLLGLLSAYALGEEIAGAGSGIALTVLLFPVGIGILRGKPSSYVWARIWLYLLGIVSLIAALSFPFMNQPGKHFVAFGTYLRGSDATPYLFACYFLVFLGILATFLTLRTSTAREYFPDAKNWDAGLPIKHLQRDRGPLGNYIHRHAILCTLAPIILAIAAGYLTQSNKEEKSDPTCSIPAHSPELQSFYYRELGTDFIFGTSSEHNISNQIKSNTSITFKATQPQAENILSKLQDYYKQHITQAGGQLIDSRYTSTQPDSFTIIYKGKKGRFGSIDATLTPNKSESKEYNHTINLTIFEH